MKNFLFCLVAVILLMSSCDDDKQQFKVELIVKALYDGNPLVMFDEYDYANSELFFSTLDVFINTIELRGNNGETLSLSDIELLDFTEENKKLSTATEGIKFSYDIGEPMGEYSSISFGVGVDPISNASEPKDFSSDNPLSESGKYWIAWDSYIFMKIQGQYDEIGNGDFALPFLYHTGTDEIHRTFNLAVSVNFDTENKASIEVELDVKKLFETNGGYFNIVESPVSHEPNVIAHMVADNLTNALKIK